MTDLPYPKESFNVEGFTPLAYDGRPYEPLPPLYDGLGKRFVEWSDEPEVVVRLLDTSGERPVIDPHFSLCVYKPRNDCDVCVVEVKLTGVEHPYTDGVDETVDYYQILYPEIVRRFEEYAQHQYDEDGRFLFISEVNNCQIREWLEDAGAIAASRARFNRLPQRVVAEMDPEKLPPEPRQAAD